MSQQSLLQQAIAAIRSGHMIEGQELLEQILKANPHHEGAWLWMSAVVKTDAERIECLQRALAVNPNNAAARQGLAQLQARVPTTTMPSKPTAPQQAATHCPRCGFDNPTEARFCGKCGQKLERVTSPPSSLPSQSKPLQAVSRDRSKPKIKADKPSRPEPSFLWRLPGLIGIGLAIIAGVLPWGIASWSIGDNRVYYMGFNIAYGNWSMGLAVVGLILLVAIRRSVIAHLITLLPIGGAVVAAVGAMSVTQHLSVGPYVVILGGVLMIVSFVLSLVAQLGLSNAPRPEATGQQAKGELSAMSTGKEHRVQVQHTSKDPERLAAASKTIGIIVLFAWLLPVCGLPLAIVGLVLGIMAKNSSQREAAKAGIVMCIIGLIASLINSVIGVLLFM